MVERMPVDPSLSPVRRPSSATSAVARENNGSPRQTDAIAWWMISLVGRRRRRPELVFYRIPRCAPDSPRSWPRLSGLLAVLSRCLPLEIPPPRRLSGCGPPL